MLNGLWLFFLTLAPFVTSLVGIAAPDGVCMALEW